LQLDTLASDVDFIWLWFTEVPASAAEQIKKLQEETALLRAQLTAKEDKLKGIGAINRKVFTKSSDKTDPKLLEWETHGDLLNCKAALRAVRQTKCKVPSCGRFLDVTVQYCQEHCKTMLGVYVARSTKPRYGCGLFAAVNLLPGTPIEYGGKIRFFDTWTEKLIAWGSLCECKRNYLIDYKTRVEVKGVQKYVIVEGSEWDERTRMGRYANHANERERNGKLVYIERDNLFFIQIVKEVPKKHEIFVDYGQEFRFDVICSCGRG
jgi:hypothetical protein